jgi:hypothetical protein
MNNRNGSTLKPLNPLRNIVDSNEIKFDPLHSILGAQSATIFRSSFQDHGKAEMNITIPVPLLNKQVSMHKKSGSEDYNKKKPTSINLLHFSSLESLSGLGDVASTKMRA